MTIEIHKPELEALIRDRMSTGAYASVEDALLAALRSHPRSPQQETHAATATQLTGAALVDAMQASPHKEIELESSRIRMPIRAARL
jgi:hypothetical protein